MSNTELLKKFQCPICKTRGKISLVYEQATVKLDIEDIEEYFLKHESYSPEIPDYQAVKFTCSECNNLIFYIKDIEMTEQEALVEYLKTLQVEKNE